MNKRGFVLSTYVYILLVFFLLLLVTMLAVLNNTKILSDKLKEQSNITSGLTDKEYSFTLLGEKTYLQRIGEEYIDPGVIAKTSKGTDLTDNVKVVGEVNKDVIGEYPLVYKITYNGISKELTRTVKVVNNKATTYINEIYENYVKSLRKDTTPDENLRYIGNDPDNYVSFNDELWRIIGIFNVATTKGGTEVPRIKIINTSSTFKASWDSSDSTVNSGKGVNQWGNTSSYAGADLMQLLNGFYIGANATCGYNVESGHSNFAMTCTSDSLKNAGMAPLSTAAKNMIDNAVWYTYAISNTDAAALYLEQKGITKKYTGCNSIEETTTKECTVDGVTRENIWQGKIGLMFASEIRYSNGWLNGNVLPEHSWNMTSLTIPYKVISIIDIGRSQQIDTSSTMLVLPATYLKENVKIVGGIGTKESPYKLSI